jgi:5-hydroxyisourate hydrolase
MSAITCHVLDTSLGQPVAGLSVSLALLEAGEFKAMGQGITDQDGRVKQLLGDAALSLGVYRLSFETGAHYRRAGRDSFYERIEIQFHVANASQHYHVPLLLSPYGYSTYRGS